MINDIKLGFKIMKYGHSSKVCIITSAVLAAFGLVYGALTIRQRDSFPAGYFMMLAQIILVQLIYTVNAANLVAASPRKKQLQTAVPALISLVLMVTAYLLTAVCSGISVYIMPESLDAACAKMITTVTMLGCVTLYISPAYKYFLPSTVVFILVYICGYPSLVAGMRQWDFKLVAGVWGNFWLFAAIGLAVILICGVLQYLVSLAVYKAPISKMALGPRLRNQL